MSDEVRRRKVRRNPLLVLNVLRLMVNYGFGSCVTLSLTHPTRARSHLVIILIC